jgi:hypothetical protein
MDTNTLRQKRTNCYGTEKTNYGTEKESESLTTMLTPARLIEEIESLATPTDAGNVLISRIASAFNIPLDE